MGPNPCSLPLTPQISDGSVALVPAGQLFRGLVLKEALFCLLFSQRGCGLGTVTVEPNGAAGRLAKPPFPLPPEHTLVAPSAERRRQQRACGPGLWLAHGGAPKAVLSSFRQGTSVWPVAGGGEGSGGVAGARPPASLALQTSPPGVRPCSLVTSTGGLAPGGGMGRRWGHRVRPS